ncbi:MAG: hypothetical protein K8R23_14815 [Chthoniobacter sp.]|nr:hypothetical protein [Chthoniobacter sp.]
MKKLLPLLALCAAAVLMILTSGCVQDYDTRYRSGYRYVPRHPEIGTPAWVDWVDKKVDTRYANNIRPEPGSQEWYAIVDYYVLRGDNFDYYPTGYYRDYPYRRSDYFGDPEGVGYSDGSRANVTYDRSNVDYGGYRTGRRTSDYYHPPYHFRDRYADSTSARKVGYYRGDYASGDTRDRYTGPARFGHRTYASGDHRNRNRRTYKLGSLEWKHAVTAALLSGRVPKPPPRSDPWDAPLSPTH